MHPGAANGVVVEMEGSGPVEESKPEAQLIDALSGITGGEYVYFDSMPHPLTRARHGLDREAATREIQESNAHILEGFAREHLDRAEVFLNYQSNGPGSKWVLVTKLGRQEIEERLVRIGGMDGNFLGAPIVRSVESDATREGF